MSGKKIAAEGVRFVYAPGDVHEARIVEMLTETRAALLVRSPYTGLDYAQEAEHDPDGSPGTWHRVGELNVP